MFDWDERIHEQAGTVSAIVTTRLKGTDLGEPVDENVVIPLAISNSSWHRDMFENYFVG